MSDDKVASINSKDSLLKVGGIIDSSSASLCFYSEDLDPEEISKVLGVEPTTGFKKGHRRSKKAQPYKRGAWIYRIEGEAPLGPGDHLKELLGRISLSREVWSELGKAYQARISIGIHVYEWNRGFTFSPQVIAMLEPLGMEVDFDIYAGGE